MCFIENLRRKLGCNRQQELTLLPWSNTTELQKKFPNLAGGKTVASQGKTGQRALRNTKD